MSQQEEQCLSGHVWKGNSLAISKKNCQMVYIYEIPKAFYPFNEDSFIGLEMCYSNWKCNLILDATEEDNDSETADYEIKFDWNQKTNTIITCSSYSIGKKCKMWKLDDSNQLNGKYITILVRCNSPCLFCKSTRDGSKFAVGSHKSLATCWYEEETGFGFSRLKKFDSTIVQACWHSDNMTVACVDISNGLVIYNSKSRNSYFRNVLESKANYLEFSPDGNWLAVLCSNSSILFYRFTSDKLDPSFRNFPNQKVLHSGLPFTCGIFLSNSLFVAAGYDNAPFLYELKESKWTLVGKLENEMGIYHSKHVHSLQTFHNSHTKHIIFTTASYDNQILFWRIPIIQV